MFLEEYVFDKAESAMSLRTVLFAVLSLGGLLGLGVVATSSEVPKEEERVFKMRPIGAVRKAGGKTFIEIDEKYQNGLLGLDGWSHVQVFWWFAKNDTPQKRQILRVHPRGNRENPLTGVFACRAPVRPNLIALTACSIVKVEGRRVYVDKIDAFDATPVIDLKPYFPGSDRIPDARAPDWTRRKAKGKE